MHAIDRILLEVDRAADEIVEFTRALVRIPTVNPPGEYYGACARLLGDQLERHRFAVEYIVAEASADHSSRYPRVNVLGTRQGSRPGAGVHLNGHIDVVPAGERWTIDPFDGVVRDGRIFGRGVCDMKAGIAAAVFAAEALARGGVDLPGRLEISGTVDEESGGFAGVAHLAEIGRISKQHTRFVIIPEPLNVDRICVGHRGVYWFELTTTGRIAHGSMPFLGVSAIDRMAEVLAAMRRELEPALRARLTAMPVVPEGARHASVNVNGIEGGQRVDGIQTPCVADRCRAVFDRRFLIEEPFDEVRNEIRRLIDRTLKTTPGVDYELRDLMIVQPVRTPADSPLIGALDRAISRVRGSSARLVASPGTYDHKHITRIAGIADCVAYGPGEIEMAHQPDESCAIADVISAAKVIALATMELAGVDGS